MVLPLINSTVLFGLEKAVNAMLSLDPAALNKIKALTGKTIAIHSQQPTFEMMILITDNGIILSQFTEPENDASVTGTAAALFQLLVNRNAGFHHKDISIQGDAELLHALQKIMVRLDIDWEYHLSRFIGDIPTQTISDSLDASRNFVKQSSQSLLLDLDEYLHEEKKWLPASHQLQEFYSRVDKLRLRTDRLQARVNKLESGL